MAAASYCGTGTGGTTNSTPLQSQQMSVNLDSSTEPDQNRVENEEPQPSPVRQSSRMKNWPIRYGFDEHENITSVDYMIYMQQVKFLIEEALSSTDADKCQAAADSEYESLIKYNTWDLVELPCDREAIPCI